MTEIQAVADLMRALGVSALFGPLLGLIASIWIIKKFILAGWGDLLRQAIMGFFQREKEAIAVQSEVAHTLQEICHQLENMSKRFSEQINATTEHVGEKIDGTAERIRTLEAVMSDFLDDLKELTESLEDKPCIITQGGTK